MKIGKTYNHDPRHFKFYRRCDGYYPEPDALPGDKFIAWALCVVCAMLVVVSAMWGAAV